MNVDNDRADQLRHILDIVTEAARTTNDPSQRAILGTLAVLTHQVAGLDKRVTAIQEHLAPF